MLLSIQTYLIVVSYTKNRANLKKISGSSFRLVGIVAGAQRISQSVFAQHVAGILSGGRVVARSRVFTVLILSRGRNGQIRRDEIKTSVPAGCSAQTRRVQLVTNASPAGLGHDWL